MERQAEDSVDVAEALAVAAMAVNANVALLVACLQWRALRAGKQGKGYEKFPRQFYSTALILYLPYIVF